LLTKGNALSRFSARSALAAITLVVMLLQGTISVLAGTTGSINGTITDADTNAPLAGAHVTVTSPSQQNATNTDAQGRFSFLSLAPDTYTLSITAAGHQTVTQAGVTVQADNNINLSFAAPRQLQRIGGTTARANTDLVKPGTTADVYSVNAAQAAAAAALGGGGALNQAYSAIASVPGVFIPQGQQGWAQAVYVRGGNYTQLGYEYDGVPIQRAYDAYPSNTLSALGQQEVQVYTGSQPGSAQSSGLAGFVNQVIKTGTYPGTGSGEVGFGTPSFYHKGQLEFGGASPDRNFSYYAGAAGYNQTTRVLDQFDGASQTQNLSFLVPYAGIAYNCGNANATQACYNAATSGGFGGPDTGLLWPSFTIGQNPLLGDREAVANLHVGVPHKRDGLKDDVQGLVDVSYLFSRLNDSYNAWGADAVKFSKTGVATFNGVSYQSCTAALLAANTPCAVNILGLPSAGFYRYVNRSIYVGPTGGALTPANLTQISPYTFPNQPRGVAANAPVDPNLSGDQQIQDAIFKLQYTHAMGPNAFVRLYGYSLYSSWLNTDPNQVGLSFFNQDYELPTHTRGLGFTVADQRGNHLLNLTAGYSFANLSRWNNSLPSSANPVAVLVDSTHPAAGCYAPSGAGTAPAYCSTGARYAVPANPFAAGAQLTPAGNGAITVANASTFTCGSGPCEYLAIQSGLGGNFNNVTPRFANLALSDTWNVTPKLTVEAALRYDSFRYDIPSATTPGGPLPGNGSGVGRELYTNSYNQWHCFTGPGSAGILLATAPNVCGNGGVPVAFSNATPKAFWYGGFQPRIGATYTVNPLNVIRAGYGRYLQPVSSAFLFYNRADENVANFDVPNFYAYGFTNPSHDQPPQESWNFDFSWEHQVRGTDLSWKVTPFFRRTRNENITVILNPITAFSSGIDALSSDVKGVELLFRKGDFSRNGFAAQLAYTYTYEKSRFQTLPGGFSALDSVNASVAGYNAYTSFCAAHTTDRRCGSTASNTPAAPCYDADGSANPGCTAGSVANPYWNAPVQNLFDTNATYYPYNQTFGTGFSANASSYNIPHVATLILNYKHDKWAVTPSFQLTAGGRYGSPVQGVGVAPDLGGCTPLTGATVAGDPRYPYGAPGGSPYLAQNCLGSITAVDPFTGHFDAPGEFIEPSQLVANLGVSYQANKRLKLNVLAVNVFGTCFGGTHQAWTNAGPKYGCWYGSGTGFQAGNLYNPGNAFAPQAYPYFPVLGGIAGQTVYGSNVQPLQVFFSAQFKM
jgi:hypothetical protein